VHTIFVPNYFQKFQMKKNILTLSVCLITSLVISQETDVKDTSKVGWSRSGIFSLLFNQATFNAEWTGGGTSNIAGNISLTYDLNYQKGKVSWDNRLIGDYGLTKNKGDEFERKTNDRLEANTIVGYQIDESLWAYSFFVNFRSQFVKGYEFNETTNPITRVETTRFMSPGYLQFGPGFLWKMKDTFKINIAPTTSRFTFVNRKFTHVGNDPAVITAFNENPYFGVEANQTSRFAFGASASAYFKKEVMENVTMENVLNLYINYLEDPQNVDVDYTMNMVMKINKLLSANLVFQAIYDDDAAKGFQIREVFGLGVNFNL